MKYIIYFVGACISCAILGCNFPGNNKLDLNDSEIRMKEILSRGDYVGGIYTSVYNDLYNNYAGIESAVKEADAIITELNSFTCTGKFELKRKSAIKTMSRIRNDLSVALDKGMEQFHVEAQKTQQDYEFFPLIYGLMENVVYDPKVRMIVIGIVFFVFVVWFIIK
ncbi:MAG: hypothetical protein PHT50_07685 [Candidatus Omnitrophica bacterium]|nr:hypothetical protein [Candidatus Omnitrophota bacterium]